MSELRDELQRAEDLRFEHEEEMWRLHELHKGDVTEQRQVLAKLHEAEINEHRQVLSMLLDEHERSQAEVELDIEEAKRRLTEDARAGKVWLILVGDWNANLDGNVIISTTNFEL